VSILGVDFGLKRFGIAFSNDSATIAFPGSVVTGTEAECIRRIAKEAEAHRAAEIVVGLPKNMNGTDGDMSNRVKAFAVKLRQATPAKVVTWDERLTSVQATRAMCRGDLSRKQRKARVDSMAAQLMLQSYLDSKSKPPQEVPPGEDGP